MSVAPTPAGFLSFIRNVMIVNPLYLPDNSPVITMAYDVALAVVNPTLRIAGCVGTTTSIYALAVYNLGGDNIVNYAQDQPGRRYFKGLRKTLGINAFAPGMTASSSDTSTAQSLLNPEFMKGLTLANLQNLKTPYGRQYLAFAQAAGPTIWGLS